jgi:FdhD protein
VSATVRTRVTRWNGHGEPSELTDEIAAEEPLEIRIAGEPVSVTMRTPGHDLELVAGLLLSESLIGLDERPVLRHEHPNVVNVALWYGDDKRLAAIRRTLPVSTSCGLCGKSSIDSVHQHFPPLEDDVTVARSGFQRMVEALAAAQQAFERTGGVHAAALFDRDRKLLVAREDVGRHNAVDKAIGHALLAGLLPLAGATLFVSGRASFEIVQKALGARIPIVAAVSAPSSLAVQLAAESGQTVVGFVRGDRCNVYSHPERVTA